MDLAHRESWLGEARTRLGTSAYDTSCSGRGRFRDRRHDREKTVDPQLGSFAVRATPRRVIVDFPVGHRVAVERVVQLLLGINWALTGSVAHRLQGAAIECGDLDIQTDEPGVLGG